MKVSIIIPVYNSEKYIGKCLESVLNQEYTNIEIVIINDGSHDDTGKIIKKYKDIDKRIKYYEQENCGPSIARNTGIERCTGNYLMFVDSDDEVDSYYVERLLNEIEKSRTDIVACGYIDQSKYGIVNLNDFWQGKATMNKYEFINSVCTGVGGVLWGKIFRRDIIIENNIRMNPQVFMSEDLLFILEYCIYAESFSSINENLYIYNRLNENSISTIINIDYLENYNFVINSIIILLSELQVEQRFIKDIIISKIQLLVNRILINEANKYIATKNKGEFINNVKFVCEDSFINRYISQFNKNNIVNTIQNKYMRNKQYNKLLNINIVLIILTNIKDKVLRRGNIKL